MQLLFEKRGLMEVGWTIRWTDHYLRISSMPVLMYWEKWLRKSKHAGSVGLEQQRRTNINKVKLKEKQIVTNSTYFLSTNQQLISPTITAIYSSQIFSRQLMNACVLADYLWLPNMLFGVWNQAVFKSETGA